MHFRLLKHLGKLQFTAVVENVGLVLASGTKRLDTFFARFSITCGFGCHCFGEFVEQQVQRFFGQMYVVGSRLRILGVAI